MTGRERRLLLADDEFSLRNMLARYLERQGWLVTAVADGLAAVEAWPDGGAPFDVVVLDVQMPRLDGARTYEILATRQPPARFLFITGYPGVEPWSEISTSPVACLTKPFKPQEILAHIEQLIAAPTNCDPA